jgi:hypothetical protein
VKGREQIGTADEVNIGIGPIFRNSFDYVLDPDHLIFDANWCCTRFRQKQKAMPNKL